MIHLKQSDGKVCFCGRPVLRSPDVTDKLSQTTCLQCFKYALPEFRMKTIWKGNYYSCEVYSKRKLVAKGELTLSLMTVDHLHNLSVLPSYRKRGLATWIMLELLKEASRPVGLTALPFVAGEEEGYKNVEQDDNLISQDDLFKFYSKFGFVRVGNSFRMVLMPTPKAEFSIIEVDEIPNGFDKKFFRARLHDKSFDGLTPDEAVFRLINDNIEMVGVSIKRNF